MNYILIRKNSLFNETGRGNQKTEFTLVIKLKKLIKELLWYSLLQSKYKEVYESATLKRYKEELSLNLLLNFFYNLD